MSRQQWLRERECPTRFENLDPRPLEAALAAPRPMTMKDMVRQYVQSMREVPPSVQDDLDDLDFEMDPEDQVLSDYQLAELAEQAAAEEVFDLSHAPDDDPLPPLRPEEPLQSGPEGAPVEPAGLAQTNEGDTPHSVRGSTQT